MPYEDVPDGNVLLAALRPAERERVLPELTEMQMDRGAVLCEAGEIVRYAWFPCNGAVAAFTVPVEHEGGVETAMVGREGVLGGIVSEGELPAYARSTVVIAGRFQRIGLARLADLKQELPSLQRLFTRYADCLVAHTETCGI